MKVRQLAMATTGLTFVTVVSGALVAGNDAGRAYNVFPHMMPDGQWLPPKEELFGDPSNNNNNNNDRFKWMTHSTAYVQLQHRILGMTTATCGLGLAIAGFLYKKQLTPQARIGLYTMGGIAVSQASLGIVTLLSYVPLHLAAAHQLGSLALLTSGLFTVHSLRYISPRILTKTAAVTTRNLPYHVPLPKNILLHKHSPV
uniref:Cytochrome oxidase assembly protein n=1 Tax=Eucampia antarctica TaxID=49252 RepID=A0A7S2R280_9STRA|mmetsp:Transcript_14385/g.13900  ORF Transcript_14385/g.13900 Transcript_14385/m.13900 type:complete len:200 (+) Transcript_14385:51-650(+)